MAVLEDLSDEECYLLAILTDHSGLDLAEFTWHEPDEPTGSWRAWPFQWKWFRDSSPLQIDQCARALDVTTPIPTPVGWTTMGALVPGDVVYDEHGNPTTVTAVSQVWYDHECYEVEFDDHTVITADAGHLWLTWTKTARRARNPNRRGTAISGVRTTAEIAKTQRYGRESNHSVDLAGPLVGGGKLPLDPYYLGFWLGDGMTADSQITCADTWVIEELGRRGLKVTKRNGGDPLRYGVGFPYEHNRKTESVQAELRRLGVLGNKHIPASYLRASENARRDLLAGLVDSDGYLQSNGSCEITQKEQAVAEGLLELLRSLGEKPRMTKRSAFCNGVDCGPVYRVTWRPRINPALLPRKAVRFVPADTQKQFALGQRRIVAARQVPPVPVRCITVDSPSHLFLAGEGMVPTHNSVGKTTSITLRMFAFPFLFPGQEAVVTAPELVHLEPLTNLIERKFFDTRLGREMLPRGRSAVTHRPFMMNFVNGSRIIGRIPQRDGKGVKGCASIHEMIWTSEGYKRAGDIQVGDRVLTHQGRYMPVTEVHPDFNDCYEVTGAGSFPMTVSCDHRFLGSENTGTPKTKRSMLPLAWHDVEFLTEHQVYWATPTKFPGLLIPDCKGWDNSRDNFWWLVGRYLADGWCDTKRALWVGPDWKIAAIEAVLDDHGKRHHRTAQRGDSKAERVVTSSTVLSAWLCENFGRLAGGKRLPAWALGMAEAHRKALFDGYLAGDGYYNEAKNRWEVGTASKELAMGVQLLAQSLGWTVNCTSVQPKVTAIAGVALKQQPQVSWRLQIGHGHSMQMDDHLVGKVKSVVPVGKQPIVNIVVADDHSYLSGTIMSHNIHPIWLELDEAQDYPEAGWTELIETLKRGHEGAVWRAHGVTRGMRDKFYEYTQDTPDNQWKVHRITAMSRPNWTDQERQEKIQQYKTRDNPDYRRNVLGLHGDATNPLFVLHRLMKVVDEDLSSEYNADTYQQLRISTEMLNDRGVKRHIAEFLSCPSSHRGFKAYWAGMDVGYTKDPSEILIFGEEQKAGKTLIRLLSRIHLERIEAPIQAEVVSWIFDIYNPRRFAMDKMQPVSEPVLTPGGWRSIGAIRVGDHVIGSDGQPTEVLGVYPQTDRRVMKVTFSDGSWTRCGPEHLWTVERTPDGKKLDRVTTIDLQRLIGSQGVNRWAIPMLSAPVAGDSADLPLDPYLLGALLGDGNLRAYSTRFASADPEVLAEVEARLPAGCVLKCAGRYDYEIVSVEAHRGPDGRYVIGRNVVLNALRDLGLAGLRSKDKFVPSVYMRGSAEQRLLLLQGLMDTDGYVIVTPNGRSCTIGIKIGSKALRDAVVELTESLGGSVRCRERTSVTGNPVYVATLALPESVNPFRLSRKAARVVGRTRRPMRRYVRSIEPDGEEESVCIRVAATDSLYVTRSHILTHNTGNGLPLFQDLQHNHPNVAEQITGYNFSEKILVDFDEAMLAAMKEGGDEVKEAGIVKSVLEYSTDKLRELVDKEQIRLPWDTELIGEFQGQTWTYSKSSMDIYGRPRRVFSQGTFHGLDAARMAALGFCNYKLEEMMRLKAQQDSRPVLDYVMDSWL
jgi:intein/homing endonuclease